MASLKTVVDRCDDNSLKLAVVIPPRRNGEPNFGALERLLQDSLLVNPAAFDPPEPADFSTVAKVTTAIIAAHFAQDDDEPGSLKAGEAYREKAP